jgi:hypothetical protein
MEAKPEWSARERREIEREVFASISQFQDPRHKTEMKNF